MKAMMSMSGDKKMGAEAFAALERGVHAALETYSNVHRGSGHNRAAAQRVYAQLK